MLLGVATEQLIDRVLKVGDTDALLAAEQLGLLVRNGCQPAPAIATPDRT
jgi:hypothetical protein